MRSYPEVDLHGMFAEQARERVEEAIADAIAGGHDRIRIVHGRGTGILRREVRDLLKYHPRVATYQYASQYDGGEGVTIAALRV